MGTISLSDDVIAFAQAPPPPPDDGGGGGGGDSGGDDGDGPPPPDTEPPVITCNDITVNNDPGQAFAVVNFDSTICTATDNSGEHTAITFSPPSGSQFNLGTTTTTATATDSSGNTATETFNVIVVDVDDPTVSCDVSTVTTSTEPGEIFGIANFLCVGQDNSGSVSISYSPIGPGGQFPIGTTEVTATATDSSGRTVTTHVFVIVEDNENPTVVCQTDVVLFTPTNSATSILTASQLGCVGSDNSGSFAITYNPALPADLPIGSNTISVTIIDQPAGNSVTEQFTVEVRDNVNPVVSCTAVGTGLVLVTPANSATAELLESALGCTVSDNSGSATLDYNPPFTSGSQDLNIGFHTILVLAVDAAGNASGPIQIPVQVQDHTPPTINCIQSVDKSTNPGTSVEITETDLQCTASDNSGSVVALSYTPSLPANFNIGTSTVTVVATDPSANQAFTSVTINVLENADSPPTVTLVSPQDGTSVIEGTNVDFTVNADDDIGIDKVELVIDGTVRQLIDLPDPLPLTLNNFMISEPLSLLDDGDSIVVRVTDSNANSVDTNPAISLQVTQDIPPTVSILEPQDGSTVEEGPITLVATLDDPDNAALDVTIDWGDGAIDTFTGVDHITNFEATHVYDEGNYAIEVAVTDGQATAVATITIEVDPADLSSHVIDSDTVGDQFVGPDETLTVTNGATLDGKITVNGGTLLLEDNCVIDGNVKSTDGNISIDSCTVNGHVRTTGGNIIIENDSTVTGNVNLKQADTVAITDNPNSFNGHVRVDGAATVNISNNNVDKNLRVKNSGDVTMYDNVVGGNLRSFDNAVGDIQRNTVTGNINAAGTTQVSMLDNDVTGHMRAANSDFVDAVRNDVGLNLRVKDSLNTGLALNTVGQNITVKNTENVGMQDNTAGKNISVTLANDAQLFDSHAGKNFVVKNNAECIYGNLTADGKLKIKDCTDVGLPDDDSPGI